ncbi:MAG TPA: hypothetical protein DEO44_00725 [Verrucomicrobia subdivision 6 bacterium]|nr:hypothetical protein [Verrucomicrobia subdivision 6 bacterium]
MKVAWCLNTKTPAISVMVITRSSAPTLGNVDLEFDQNHGVRTRFENQPFWLSLELLLSVSQAILRPLWRSFTSLTRESEPFMLVLVSRSFLPLPMVTWAHSLFCQEAKTLHSAQLKLVELHEPHWIPHFSPKAGQSIPE